MMKKKERGERRARNDNRSCSNPTRARQPQPYPTPSAVTTTERGGDDLTR